MKTALVLEGGGMRGAYTAGCLAWLIDNDITFTSAYGISTGAVHLGSYLEKNIDFLYDLSTNHIADKKLIGLSPLLREHHYVGYDYLFEHILPIVKHYDLKEAKKSKVLAKYGLYDMEKGETVFKEFRNLDEKLLLLKGACTLPILGKPVNFEGKEYLDGGITKMIPIEEAIKDQNDRYLIITTKPYDYVRKPAKNFIVNLMKKVYKNCPKISEDYRMRHINYEKQITLVRDLEKKGDALYMCPSTHINVKRLTGDKPNLRKLYELGYNDMENRKDEICQYFKLS